MTDEETPIQMFERLLRQAAEENERERNELFETKQYDWSFVNAEGDFVYVVEHIGRTKWSK